MTRRAKTVRNFAVILIVLAAVFWKSALYLTSDACVLASVEELGYGTCEIIRRDAYEDGYIYVLRTVDDDWTQDVILTVIPSGWENAQGNVRAYDAAGNLVCEKEVIG